MNFGFVKQFEGAASPIMLMNNNGQASLVQNTDPMASQMNLIKSICAICSDKASGKHYGVYSCEGCKGFFKRTVRKDLTYSCRDNNDCIIDKRQRNRCQACRYQKCLTSGMKREAVQEERQKNRENNAANFSLNQSSVDGMDSTQSYQIGAEFQTFLDKLLEAERSYMPDEDFKPIEAECTVDILCTATEKQLNLLVQWAKMIPEFDQFTLDDQVCLLKANWKELICCCLVYRSIPYNDCLLLANGYLVNIETCQDENFRYLLQRISQDIVYIMRELQINQIELVCLKTILLYDPDAKNLREVAKVTELRDKTCLALSQYCKANSPNDPSRFAKLLMRLPSMRTWSLKGIENLFFQRASGIKFDDDTNLANMILNKTL